MAKYKKKRRVDSITGRGVASRTFELFIGLLLIGGFIIIAISLLNL